MDQKSEPKRRGNPNWGRADSEKGIKGVSGNPRGRPGNDVAMFARDHAEEAMGKLLYWMRSTDNPAISVKACGMILDRAFGKPREYHHMAGDVRVGLAHEERVRIIDAICSFRSTSTGLSSSWVIPKT